MNILIVGVGRSGTTWLGEMLGSCPDTKFISEPDAPQNAPEVKAHIGHHPIIAPGSTTTDGAKDVRPFYLLWDYVFNPYRRDYKNVIAKSIGLAFCVEWMVERFHIDRVIWIKRNLMNVIASMITYEKAANNYIEGTTARRLAWLAAHKWNSYERLTTVYSSRFYIPVNYENLVRATVEADLTPWSVLVSKLGLAEDIPAEMSAQLAQSLSPGDELKSHPWIEGYNRWDHTHRSPEQLLSQSWEKRMSDEDIVVTINELRKWGIDA